MIEHFKLQAWVQTLIWRLSEVNLKRTFQSAAHLDVSEKGLINRVDIDIYWAFSPIS